MHTYIIETLISPTLRDGRLFVADFLPRRFRMTFREGHISEALLLDLGEYLRHVRSIMTYDPSRVNESAGFDTLLERRPSDTMPCRLFAPRTVGTAHKLWRLNANHITADLVNEINAYAHKEAGGVLQLIT